MPSRYVEPKDRLDLRLAVERWLAKDRCDLAIDALKASPLGADVLAEGFGGAYTELSKRESLVEMLLGRPEGAHELEAFLTAGIGGLTTTQAMHAVMTKKLYSGALTKSMCGLSVYEPALAHPQAMAMLLRLDANRVVLDNATEGRTPHYQCLKKTVAVLNMASSTGERELQSLDLLLAAKAPVQAFNVHAPSLRAFVHEIQSEASPSTRRLFAKYIDAGLIAIDGLTDMQFLGKDANTLGACVMSTCFSLAAELLERGCSTRLQVDGDWEVMAWMQENGDPEKTVMLQEAILRHQVGLAEAGLGLAPAARVASDGVTRRRARL